MTTDNARPHFDPHAPVGHGEPTYAPQHLDASPEIPEGRHSAPVCQIPPGEFLMSLNGFDEIAIASHYGQKIGDMREADVITTGRALAFVHMRRQGQRDKEAHEASMTLTMREVVEYFAPEPKPDAEGNAEGA